MHKHLNDEIISYMRTGRMQHTDSAGKSELYIARPVDGDERRPRYLHHEKRVVGDDQIEMLQIFVRPEAADEEPIVQFVQLDEIKPKRSMAVADRTERIRRADLRTSGHLFVRYPSIGRSKYRPPVQTRVRSLALYF